MEQNNKKKKFKKKDGRFIKKLKQRIYSWHRIIGIITVIPVVLWCLSGVMHPFMAHFFKPEIANERIEVAPIAQHQLPLSLQTVLTQHQIEFIKQFRIVSLDNTLYYQVKTTEDQLRYFNVTDASELPDGDKKYAEWLSRYFLDDPNSKLKSSEVIDEFDSQYKYVNRYLPVHKLTFDRPDEMQVYVETASSKLATFNPKSRQFFIWFFDTFHNWSFLDAIANTTVRIWIMLLLLSVIVFSALSGIVIYGLFWKQFRKQMSTNEPSGNWRRNHRKIGITLAFVTLTFALSGAYHAFSKLKPSTLSQMVYEPVIAVKDIKIPNNKMVVDWLMFLNSSVVKMNNRVYYQIQTASPDPKKTITTYMDATNGVVHKDKELEYVQFLALTFSDKMSTTKACCEMEEAACKQAVDISDAKLLEHKTLFEFEKREYGFVNKRLPVIKLVYDTPEKATYYIETRTSRLAAVITNADRIEGYSFAIFHKFLFMDWAGKNIRDLVMVLSAMGVLVVCLLGLVLLLKRK